MNHNQFRAFCTPGLLRKGSQRTDQLTVCAVLAELFMLPFVHAGIAGGSSSVSYPSNKSVLSGQSQVITLSQYFFSKQS